MLRIFASMHKEWLLLRRDRAGLLVLFLMPAILVIVITLVQENVLELSGAEKIELLVLDEDAGSLFESLEQSLAKDSINLRRAPSIEDKAAFQHAIAKGAWQAGLYIAKGASAALTIESLDQGAEQKDGGAVVLSDKASVELFFDPAVMPGFRAGMRARVAMAMQAIELETKIARLVSTPLAAPAQSEIHNPLARSLPNNLAATPFVSEQQIRSILAEKLIDLQEADATLAGEKAASFVNPVQYNVPAWALFGIFFIAIPIAGGILEERRSGILTRLRGMPVSPLQLFIGKLLAYVLVCLLQFGLAALIGVFIFPLLQLPAFTLKADPVLLLAIALLASLAACGYGIFLGMACRSYEQASTIGATSVVAAAAMGGVMVPVYAMPEAMQRLSVLSPLNWAVSAFADLLARGAGFALFADQLLRLLVFFLLSLLLSWRLARY